MCSRAYSSHVLQPLPIHVNCPSFPFDLILFEIVEEASVFARNQQLALCGIGVIASARMFLRWGDCQSYMKPFNVSCRTRTILSISSCFFSFRKSLISEEAEGISWIWTFVQQRTDGRLYDSRDSCRRISLHCDYSIIPTKMRPRMSDINLK